MLKRHKHTPAHLLRDNTPYFITGAIYRKRRLIADSDLKQILLELIKGYLQKNNWELHHWVILDNHYHLIGKSCKGKILPEMMRNIHRFSGIPIRKATSCEKPVWWNYWDYCPRDEKDYLIRVNYLLNNPVKHGYTDNLRDYPFSSFHKTYADMGRDQLAEQFRRYPEYKTLVLWEAQEDDF